MSQTIMPLAAILTLAAGTYAFRVTGPLLRDRLTLSPALQTLFTTAAVVMLMSLVVSASMLDGDQFAGWARPLGVAVAAGLCLAKMPFPVIVIGAAVTTAGLRMLGIA
ncbi:AzlD domain-containing protein [Microvirga tunisiensis]|uniref:AzlD domain-containing protein n=2 Tax=Pannonibacter tanglangensis TaxID=2750084 RepID=A0ABW9ZQA9_9HYPH|nr:MULTISPECIES: AzlD domain-containing protein [unclassified Pannonibacter]NBN64905.1 AzlD domain-containing protein [Pannonibacter sp. XCT-34]NBN79408.1 AzlD domain-containing protein [Pannonibacter sp. XCT-53]